MPKLIVFALLALAAWAAITLNQVKVQTSWIQQGQDRIEATRAALTGSACIACHSPESGNMLPIRKSLDKASFVRHVRGQAPFHGYSTCPAFGVEQVSEAEINRIYKILYGNKQ
jgi:mono/diheme cytochrome c family protein